MNGLENGMASKAITAILTLILLSSWGRCTAETDGMQVYVYAEASLLSEEDQAVAAVIGDILRHLDVGRRPGKIGLGIVFPYI